MKTMLPFVTALTILGLGTAYHGIMTERWFMRKSATLDQFTERVTQIPLTIGDWEGTDDTIDPEEFKLTNCTAYIQRNYRHKKTGDMVSLYVVSGSGRNITIHTPDWCYRAKGFLLDDDPITYRISVKQLNPDPEFATAVFRGTNQDTGVANVLRIFWTYSMDGRWRGPNWAKLTLSRYPALYKIYVIYGIPPGREAEPSKTPIPNFVEEVLPVINQTLFPPPEESEKSDNTARQPTGAQSVNITTTILKELPERTVATM